MRTVRYKTHWSYAGKAGRQEARLSEFILDIVYLMEHSGVIPPFVVLNSVLARGGGSGGMGPGTAWRPFQISGAEYSELRAELLSLDIAEAKRRHPYISFHKIVEDETLDQVSDYHEWLQLSFAKYAPTNEGQPNDHQRAP